ncbi:MAG: hypothetical protein HY535_04060 [Chloroflexi bacterium]|nr:hypothetical protein [Chloroflexota bacterium]
MADKTALVVGGTGPVGPFIVEGLVERGYDVTILHRGFHEVPFKYPVEHIHGDAYFKEEFQKALGSRTFDLVVAMYGRLRYVAEVCFRRTGRFIAVGAGSPDDQRLPIYDWAFPFGGRQDSMILAIGKIGQRIVESRELVLGMHDAKDFNVTYFGFPNLYGPRQPGPMEWNIMRRILDGRRRFILLDGGLHIHHRPYVENAAYPVLLAVDKPEVSAGQFYACAEEAMPTDRYRLQLIVEAMGVPWDEIETYSFPFELGVPGWWWGAGDFRYAIEGRPPHLRHTTVSLDKLKRDLGYHDLVPLDEGYMRAVRWLLENEWAQKEAEEQLGDPFDYRAEDAYIEAYKEFARKLEAIPFAGFTHVHEYAHPQRAWQEGPTATIAEPKTARGQARDR